MCYFKVNSFKRLRTKQSNAWDVKHPDYAPKLAHRLLASYDFYGPMFMWVFGVVAMVAGTYSAVSAERQEGTHMCIELDVGGDGL